MELLKQPKDLEFKWHDVTFLVRAKAAAADKFEIDMLYDVDKKGAVTVPRREIYRTLIERFVTGWRGVTEDGQDAPFSLDALGRLPIHAEDDVVLLLGSFIINHTGIFPAATEKKSKV